MLAHRIYCEERWEITIRHAEHLIAAAKFGDKANNCSLQVPSREAHIRPLLDRLDSDDDRIAVWRERMDLPSSCRTRW